MHIGRGQKHRTPLQSLLLFSFALIFAACSSSSSDATSTAVESPDVLSEPADSEQVETQVLSEAAVPEVPGAPLNRFDLQVGDCFNEGSWFDEELDRRIDLTASIDCDQPHQNEVYFDAAFPAPASAQFPGDDALAEWSTQLCYDAFEPFIGLEYELSAYEIGFVQPTRETFEHPVGLHRRVFCYVFDVAGSDVVGTVEGSAG